MSRGPDSTVRYRAFTIDVDIGSTCTDGFFTDGDGFRLAKVLTTPHDLAECTLTCIAAGAKQFGLDPGSFLRGATVTRLSTTLGTNLVVQRAGTCLGLLVTRGQAQALYGQVARAPILDLFVSSNMVLELDEEIDQDGRIRREPSRDEVLGRVRALLEAGARIIVVSLRNSWRNPHNEYLVRSYVHERYPVQYLRSVPIQIGSEVVHATDDHARTNSAILNAYLHPPMARSLYRIEDRLRDHGYNRPLLVVHAYGGSGRIAKTVALNTLSSGPAVAVRGAAELCRSLGITRALTIDMGGTSLDAAVIIDHQYRLEKGTGSYGVKLAIPTVAVESIGAGGSTIARVIGGRVSVGPESQGIAPGPACFSRGGTEATITDVNLALGYIDPGYFLGGDLKLDRSRSERAIQRHIAAPLKLEIVQAASLAREAVVVLMSEKLRAMLKETGEAPQRFTMFVLGGCGALHACAVADRIGVGSLIAFPYSSVFSAFGASTTDVQHTYSRTVVASAEPQARDRVLNGIDLLVQQAARDMELEGFNHDEVSLLLRVFISGSAQPIVIGRCRLSEASSSRWSDDLINAAGSAGKAGSLAVEINVLAEAGIPHWNPSGAGIVGHGAHRPAIKSERYVHWNAQGSLLTPIFDDTQLTPGATIEGPGIVESSITNYVVAPGWQLKVDGRNNYLMERMRD